MGWTTSSQLRWTVVPDPEGEGDEWQLPNLYGSELQTAQLLYPPSGGRNAVLLLSSDLRRGSRVFPLCGDKPSAFGREASLNVRLSRYYQRP